MKVEPSWRGLSAVNPLEGTKSRLPWRVLDGMVDAVTDALKNGDQSNGNEDSSPSLDASTFIQLGLIESSISAAESN